jgi:hypothetical protein
LLYVSVCLKVSSYISCVSRAAPFMGLTSVQGVADSNTHTHTQQIKVKLHVSGHRVGKRHTCLSLLLFLVVPLEKVRGGASAE